MAYPNTAMKWLYAVEQLALRAVAPRRAARSLRPTGAGNDSGRALCAGGVVAGAHSHHQIATPLQCPDAPQQRRAPWSGAALAPDRILATWRPENPAEKPFRVRVECRTVWTLA